MYKLLLATTATFVLAACASTTTSEDLEGKHVGYDENGKKVSAEDLKKRGKQVSYKKEGEDKVICRAYDEVGSRLKRVRSCKKKSEWAEERREAKENRKRSSVGPGVGGAATTD